MDSCVYWKFDSIDVLQNFIHSDLTLLTVKNVFRHFEMDACELSPAPISAAKAVLIHSNSDYNFSSVDLDWLDCAPTTIIGYTKESLRFIVTDVYCNINAYYLYCAALIKIFNIAFAGDNIYLFKIQDGFAIGGKRDYLHDIENNFCVTDFFNTSNIIKAAQFMEELFDGEILDYPYIIISNSPESNANKFARLDAPRFDIEYINCLFEFQSLYGVDCSKEISRYIESFGEDKSSLPLASYIGTCDELKFTAERGTNSSFEYLTAALLAKSNADRINENESFEMVISNDTFPYTKETLSDAAVLLQEMQQRDKGK